MIKLKCKVVKDNVVVDVSLKKVSLGEYLGAIYGLIDSVNKNLNSNILNTIVNHYGEELKND